MNPRRLLLSTLSGTGAALLLPALFLPDRGARAQSPAGAATKPPQSSRPALPYRDVARHYADVVHASYADTLAAARAMRSAIMAFLVAPSETGLDNARRAWLAARELYGQTEAYRFYGGPIDDDNGPEGRLNAWPLDEAYVDYVEGDPASGLINNPRFRITKANLAEANEKGGEENISTGWHAIEFLLWGQDLNDAGPGQRSFRDFVDGGKPHADRRRQVLAAITELLLDDLDSLVRAWAPGQKNYRAAFEAGGRESVRKIIVGIGSLSRGELAGERMEVALNTQDQEDEHSCFSDNTHRDAATNALGIRNVWLGQYRRRDGSLLAGPGLRDLVAAVDTDLATKTTAQIAESVRLTEAIPAPFDQAIGVDAPGRKVIEQAIASLVEQSRLLVASANAIGIARLTLVQP